MKSFVLDPRTSVIGKRLSGIKKIIAVTGWKGGIGKSVTASALALILSKKGKRVGLIDLDFTGASCHVILGAKNLFPEEQNGIIPPDIFGIKFMSISFFAKNNAVPLRGASVTDAVIELFAITQWGKLDYLIMDMPPGINDTALDITRLVKKAEILAVTIPSIVAKDVLNRSMALYKGLKVPIKGIIENMSSGHKSSKGLLGRIPFDKNLEKALGNPDKILKTDFAEKLKKILHL